MRVVLFWGSCGYSLMPIKATIFAFLKLSEGDSWLWILQNGTCFIDYAVFPFKYFLFAKYSDLLMSNQSLLLILFIGFWNKATILLDSVIILSKKLNLFLFFLQLRLHRVSILENCFTLWPETFHIFLRFASLVPDKSLEIGWLIFFKDEFFGMSSSFLGTLVWYKWI